ncbi:MAG: serine/threonine-protein kinase [Gemmatimonadales bacterium]|nr:serine/threonine-protein kinase [Gemmatimonadales bacterium]
MTLVLDRLTAALADRYRIERELGRGGMATVYLGQDLKHDRLVALKVLKPELAAMLGAERFVQEIKTTAALQHPHILPLFDSGEADGFLYYVMPYIQGETLRAKLDRETQLGIDEAVRLTTNVADALDYAHRHGVIHRDIKPENILLHDGRPMVADFGIALALSAAAGGRMTETGMSLGTPHYMSPEQATADKEITGRSDVYSLGSVLYEMLTGNPPHTGSSAQQIIMKIVTEEAAPVTKLRKAVPPNVAAAVAKSIEKLPADRFASAKEFADALTTASFTVVTSARAQASAPKHRFGATHALAVVSGAVLLLVAAWGWLRTPREPTLHVTIPLPPETSFLAAPRWPALSPDGRTVVFAASSDGTSRLYRRPVNGFRIDAIEGSDDATYPFFSPDGEWVGYFTRARQLRKVPLAGGRPTTLADIPFWRSGAAWRRDGTIVVLSDARGLYSVPDRGGTLSPFAESDSVALGMRLESPLELADGTLLATRASPQAGWDFAGSLMRMPPGSKRWRVVADSAWGVYLAPGFLISRAAGGAMATPFDLESGRRTGKPVAVLEGFSPSGNGSDLADLTVNERGDAAYFAFPTAPPHLLALVDRTGRSERLAVAAGAFRHLRLSRDGTRLAVNRESDLWVLDLRANTWTRITTNASTIEPQWSPDGKRIAHTVFDTVTGYNPPAIRSADGSGSASIIGSVIGDAWTSDWSPDGRHLAVYGGKVGMNVGILDLDTAHTFHPVTSTAAIARNARFSPDGRWLAYQSNETGKMQVYVVSFPELAQKRPISTEGGTEPAWHPHGGELYYRNGASMMAVTIRTSPSLDVGTPRELFRGPFLEDLYGDRSYDVMPDGEHFVMLEANPAAAPELRVIRNWGAELEATVGRR